MADEPDPLLASMAGALAAHGYLVHAPDKSAVAPTKVKRPSWIDVTVTYETPAQRFRDHPNPENVVFDVIREGFNQNLDDHQIRLMLRHGYIVLMPRMGMNDTLVLDMRLKLQEQEPGPQATEVTVAPPPPLPSGQTLTIYGETINLPAKVRFPPVDGGDMLVLKDVVRRVLQRAGMGTSNAAVDGVILRLIDEFRRRQHDEYEEKRGRDIQRQYNEAQARYQAQLNEPYLRAKKILGFNP